MHGSPTERVAASGRVGGGVEAIVRSWMVDGKDVSSWSGIGKRVLWSRQTACRVAYNRIRDKDLLATIG
jgi:hypothetical protein